jgi:DNA-directed RNA polymerase specialized sigma24 family protein
MSEEDLIRDIARGGRAGDLALRSLYDGSGRHMLRFFVYSGVSGDEAKDILQETLVKLVRYAGTYNGDGAARAWMWQIARNCLADHQRRAGRLAEHVVAVDDEQWEYIADTRASPADCGPGETADECVAKGLARIFHEQQVGSLVPRRVYIGISPPMETEDCRCQSVPIGPSNLDGLEGEWSRPHSTVATSSAMAVCCCSSGSMSALV